MTLADDDLEALQAAAAHYDIDPTAPDAEEWLRGSPHYRWTRFGLAARRMGQQIFDAVEPLRTVFATHNMADPESVVHRSPLAGQGITPCCERSPFELPIWDRITTDPAAVTCSDADG